MIAGDFNSGEGSKAYRSLVRGNLIDTFRIAHPTRSEEESTSPAWNGRLIGNRIGWVLCGRNFKTDSAGIDRSSDNGQY